MEGIEFSAKTMPPHRDKPPDNVDGGGQLSQGQVCSFRDKLMGNKQALPRRDKADLLASGLVRVDRIGGTDCSQRFILIMDCLRSYAIHGKRR